MRTTINNTEKQMNILAATYVYVAYSMHALKDIQLRRRYKPEPKIRAEWAR